MLTRAVEVYDYDLHLKMTLAKVFEANQNTSKAVDVYKAAIATSIQYKFSYEKQLQQEIDRLLDN